jgi:hypothetical protein
MATAQDAGGEDGRTQQKLTSGRLSQNEGREGVKAGWFPLSAKEGLSQWVCLLASYREG